jgi:hypothetical protein
MNRIDQLVLHRKSASFDPTSQITAGRGKSGSEFVLAQALTAALLAICAAPAFAVDAGQLLQQIEKDRGAGLPGKTTPEIAPVPQPMKTMPGVTVTVSISLTRQPSEQQTGIITVSVPKDMTTAGSDFSFSLPVQMINAGIGSNAVINATTANGQPLPSWLQFNQATNAFDATDIPAGALPIQVVVTVGGKRSTIVISQLAIRG